MRSFSINIPSIEVWSFKKRLKQLKFLGWEFAWIQDWGLLYSTFILKGSNYNIKYIYNYCKDW